ncbi:hypothetical protein HK097_004353 [Rhizophlyctis rosea]|uniref:SAM-dependent MTase RsmB/NOP-type domain-containing protein n=1 Tax=Rhizophlyctis rosea TaxID=64517 RepID=A0AAD5SHG1_9FUNG|nr:hypothetical protein HK097_004353 [Rhizophlyctis rosea]
MRLLATDVPKVQGLNYQQPITISVADLILNWPEDQGRGIRDLTKEAIRSSPSIVIFQNVERLFPSKAINLETYHAVKDVINALSSLTDKTILVFGETWQIDDIHAHVRSIFQETISFDPPTPAQRQLMLESFIKGYNIICTADLGEIGGKCHGYGLGDIAALCSEAVGTAMMRVPYGSEGNIHVETADFISAMKDIKPSAAEGKLQAAQIQEVRWSDVGGHESVKALLEESVGWFYRNAAAFERLGVQPSKGVLLYGPPGTGKTMLAKAVAFESGANFLPISVTAIVKGEVGESEKAIARIFAEGRKQSPCIIFFDELESLFSRRSSSGDLGQKLFSQLVLEMDALSWDDAQVVLLGATNHPGALDPALLRSGRLDRLIPVPPPSEAERASILRVILSKMPACKDVDFEDIAKRTVGMTGADLRELARRAGISAVQRGDENGEPPQILQTDLLSSLQSFLLNTVPTTHADPLPSRFPPAFLKFLEENELDLEQYAFDEAELPRYVRVNTRHSGGVIAEEELEREFGKVERVEWLEGFWRLEREARVGGSECYKTGKIYGIDVSSGVAVKALGVGPDDHVLDVCAAPGGKLCYVADLQGYEGRGTITGVDISPHRMATCKNVTKKYKLDRVRLFVADGTTFNVHAPTQIGPYRSPAVSHLYSSSSPSPSSSSLSPTPPITKPLHASKLLRTDPQFKLEPHTLYDKVLVDAECTHDGSIVHLVKHDRMGWGEVEKGFLEEGRLKGLEGLQRGLISNGFRMLKPGGVMVYSTCSLSKRQNEDIVGWFLSEHKDTAILEPVEDANKFPLAPRVHSRYDAEVDLTHCLRFSPVNSRTSGLFVARIRKLPV